ncbi:MAG: RNA-binding domain-containing protein [Candidatus Jordarchaeales archaeon]
MRGKGVAGIEFQVFAHSTEDPDKVIKALFFLSDEKLEVAKEKVRGHYGNEVIIFRAKASGREAEKIVRRLASLMSEEDKAKIGRQLSLRCDGHGNLFLRFDKQKAYLGEVRLSDYEDVVRAKIKFSRNKLEEIREICKTYNLIVE